MENHEKAEIDYLTGMKYKDIAARYDTTINTIKSWKKRYGWERKGCTQKGKKGCTQKTPDNLPENVPQNGESEEGTETEALTPKQQIFCLYYIKTYNATQSYVKAYGCKYETAMSEASRTLRNPKIKAELERLKKWKKEQLAAEETDIVELQMRIAFADIGTVVRFVGNGVQLLPSAQVDTQLIRKVSEGKDGVRVEMEDRQKAIEWLTKYFFANQSAPQEESNGFIEALNSGTAALFAQTEAEIEE